MDYTLIDSGNGRRLEKFAGYLLDRPDPEVLWDKHLQTSEWEKADAKFNKISSNKGEWIKRKGFPDSWIIQHDDLKFKLKLSPFKHTGLFPEQSWQWDFIRKNVDSSTKLLNLFGYTGASSISALAGDASVTHIDGSRPAISWFKENIELNNLTNKKVRYIPDDVMTFVSREIKRGNKYDAVIMDPPVYGHGPKGEKWDFSKDFPMLLENVQKIISDNPKFIIINAYAVSTSSTTLVNILRDKFSNLEGIFTHGELTLNEQSSNRILSTGIWAMWSKN